MMIDVLRRGRPRRDGAGRPRQRRQPLPAAAGAGLDVVRGRARGADARRGGRATSPTRTPTCTRPARPPACGSSTAGCSVLERPPMADDDSANHCASALRLHRSRRHDARHGRVAAARRRGQLLDARGPRARGLPPRRRRGRDQVRPPQGTGVRGRAPDRPALVHLRDGQRARGRRRGGLPDRLVRAVGEESVHDQIERAGRAAPAAGDVPRPASSPTRRGTPTGCFSHLFRGEVPLAEVEALFAEHELDLRLVDNGITARRSPELIVGRGAHLPPDPGRGREGAGGRDAHAPPRARARRR